MSRLRAKYHARGKLLLTAEYLVTQGAQALAVPTHQGQFLSVFDSEQNDLLRWRSKEKGRLWFECHIDPTTLEVLQTTDTNISEKLISLLDLICKDRPEMPDQWKGTLVETNTDFPLNWGLGTSSTLISLLGQWTGVDPYKLLQNTFGGSGYDIACAQAEGPIIYRLENGRPLFESVDWDPDLLDKLLLVYSGKKQVSSDSLKGFFKARNYSKEDIAAINGLTQDWLAVSDIEELEDVIARHEDLMAGILQALKVKDRLFSDYPYQVKSLGAWGGDFLLVTCRDRDEAREYFHQKGYRTVIPFDEMTMVRSPQIELL